MMKHFKPILTFNKDAVVNNSILVKWLSIRMEGMVVILLRELFKMSRDIGAFKSEGVPSAIVMVEDQYILNFVYIS